MEFDIDKFRKSMIVLQSLGVTSLNIAVNKEAFYHIRDNYANIVKDNNRYCIVKGLNGFKITCIKND